MEKSNDYSFMCSLGANDQDFVLLSPHRGDIRCGNVNAVILFLITILCTGHVYSY